MRKRQWVGLIAAVLGLAWVLWPSEPEQARDQTEANRKPRRPKRTAREQPRSLPSEADQQAGIEALTEGQEQTTLTCAVDTRGTQTDEAQIRFRRGPRLQWRLEKRALLLFDAAPRGYAVLDLADLSRVTFEWDEEGCVGFTSDQMATIHGTVLHASRPGSRRARVRGCGTGAPVEKDGSYEVQITPKPCELAARRADGPLLAVSDPVFVDPRPGEVIEVDLELPAYRMTGLGFSFQLVAGGVELVKIHEDTPASDGGLQSGDTILTIDGESTEEMTTDDVRATVGGEVGTTVQLTVLRGEKEITVEFDRESLDHALPRRKRRRHHGKRHGD